MKLLKPLGLACFAFCLMASSATAADLIEPIEPVEPLVDWSGFYAGIHVGWGWGEADFNADDDSDFGGTLVEDGFSTDLDGPVAGAQIGFNWQINQFLLGIEADASWSGIDGDIDIPDIEPPPPGNFFNADVDVEWLASLRARAGVLFDSLLLYATGGIAFAGLDAKAETDYAGYLVGISSSESNTHTGWVIGGGAEMMLASNVTGRVEFLHYDFDDEDFFFRFDPASDAYDLFGDADFHVNVVRAGVNILF